MKIKLYILWVLCILCSFYAADLVQEILYDKNSKVDSATSCSLTPTISCNFATYDCPKMLSSAIADAVNSAIETGNFPILVCDIDETLIKRNLGYPACTDLYAHIKSTDTLFKAHGLLALTARVVSVENIMAFTKDELNLYTPEFFTCLKNPSNLGGNLGSLDFSLEQRFLHDYGLVIMGQGGLTKRQALDVYLNKALNDSNKKYELLFVDNDIGWFQEFCNVSGYDSKIVKGHFFHYNWEIGEKVQVISLPPTVDDERLKEIGDLNELRDSIKTQLEASKLKQPRPVKIFAGRFIVTETNEEDDFIDCPQWDFSTQ